ncbi:hypothetical protein PGT21_023549 [Puccinia graminis f. sp. tritici]|uniref:mRNA-decapping enzyme 1B n=2 Tax=Puccinia graminis f. sp. tritici TaxID=56615 RepID=E3KCY6_PUCGT|nr:uncharacterized protein PGTG_07661 [Puccinia graminis f. sp. tritici CRL 75-36-700-3]EFP82264.1 hypothetical protein PGTG_07661 [Puccinia graminis f. sp. tritici CRL 75-36-700-3]KAA1065064.1 hypothetical protein PGT21_023549 [Puccinia graminis f. sp. tritici]
MDPRTINFNVLRRHDPQISSILDSTSYAVIYRYFHGAWSKTGFEGTLFIFQRDTHPFYGVFVLNRQGLDNLCEGLLSGWDVDLDEGLIIWRSAGATGDADDDVIYGIWVYEEKDRTRIATTMQELIETASASQKPPSTQQQEQQQQPTQPPPSSSPPPVSLSHPVPRVPIITAGQTISLDQLFGVGSVCSEPPPQTSALPHPGASVTDPDEEKENLLPSQVMSPDPSDLPKGMQLLDSLFQKAAIKSQPGSHQSNPAANSEPTHQHPTSIHQLLNQLSGTGSKPQNQINPNHQPSSQPTHNRRDRRQSSGQENFKHQSATIDQSAAQPAHRTINPNHPTTRTDYPRSINHPHSRRSSGGSSSHSRNTKIPISLNPTTQSHPHTLPGTDHPVNLVPAPVPIENANAEARHNILSLLGHPAATRPDDVYSAGTTLPNPTLVAPPPGNNHTVWPHSSPDSRGASNPRNLYSPQQHSQQGAGPTSHHAYSSPRSRVASQEPSPHLNSQQQQPLQQGFHQHPLPIPSYGTSADRTPPRGAQISSANHSPNGPRPPIDSRHPHQSSGAANNASAGSAGSQSTTHPNGGGGSAWTFDKLPNRALSPLNPARQSPASLAVHRARAGPHGYSNNTHTNNRKSFQPTRQQQQQQQHLPVENSPPLVNDSSRPSRSHSYNDHNTTSASNTRQSPSSTTTTAHPPGPTVVNSKLAVESLDRLLVDHNLDPQSHHPHQQTVDADNPLDKAHFVNSILDLINNNGPFVDTLYARYLARYAEKYL